MYETRFFDSNGTIICANNELFLKHPDTEKNFNAIIVPNFLQNLGFDPAEVFTAIINLPTYAQDAVLERNNGSNPMLLPGAHSALNYRGHNIRRTKAWFQTAFEKGYVKYGYTGWQWEVALAQASIESVPIVNALLVALNARLPPDLQLNHAIATIYNDGKDSIGFHSDKVANFTDKSGFVCIKLGAPRLFQFATKKLNEEDVLVQDKVFFSKELAAGTAVIVGQDANTATLHGVPEMPDLEEASGSIVFRSIKTVLPWPEVQHNIAKANEDKVKRVAEKAKRSGEKVAAAARA